MLRAAGLRSTIAFLVLASVAIVVAAEPAKRGFFGAWLGPDVAVKGAQIMNVVDGSPAAEAKLLPQDVVTAVGNDAIADSQALVKKITSLSPGSEVVLKITRAGSEIRVPIKIGAAPAFDPRKAEAYPQERNAEAETAGPVLLGDTVSSGITRISGIFTAVGGGFTQTWAGVFDIAIDRRTDHAFLYVSGDVTLSGILFVEVTDIKPRLGDQFKIIRGAKSIQGEFGKLLAPLLDNGLKWQIVYDDVAHGKDLDGDGKNDVTLVVVADETKEK